MARAAPGLSAERPLVIVDAPTNLGLAPQYPEHQPGTRKAPDALRLLGLHAALSPDAEIRIEAAAYTPDEDRDPNVRNMAAIAEHALRLADAIEPHLRREDFVLVLGGDCSLLVGAALANARVGPTGLVFIDGHTDFYLPEQSATGGAAGMDLALATGWGPPALTSLDGRRLYIEPSRVAAFGNRDLAVRPAADLPAIGDAVCRYMPLQALRDAGLAAAWCEAIAAISPEAERYWVHLDVDVLESELMPAVDSPQPGGLDWSELEELLLAVLGRKAVGLQVTIYDPERDPGASAGRRLAELLVHVVSHARGRAAGNAGS